MHLRWSRCRLKVNRPTQRFSFWVLFTVVTMSHYLNMTSRPYTTSHCLNITWQHYMTTSSFSITISQHDITLSQHDITISHDITWHDIVTTSHCLNMTSRPSHCLNITLSRHHIVSTSRQHDTSHDNITLSQHLNVPYTGISQYFLCIWSSSNLFFRKHSFLCFSLPLKQFKLNFSDPFEVFEATS